MLVETCVGALHINRGCGISCNVGGIPRLVRKYASLLCTSAVGVDKALRRRVTFAPVVCVYSKRDALKFNAALQVEASFVVKTIGQS